MSWHRYGLPDRCATSPAFALLLFLFPATAKSQEGDRRALEDRLKAAEERIRRLEEELAASRPAPRESGLAAEIERARRASAPDGPEDGGLRGLGANLAAPFDRLVGGPPPRFPVLGTPGYRERGAKELPFGQAPAFQTPGMPNYPAQGAPGADMSQANRFSSVFNPAFSFVVDAVGDYQGGNKGEDGFQATLRTVELTGQSWVDPNAWAYFVAATEEGEEGVNLEEGAVHFLGLGGNTTIRAGRFFIDFGKQMQIHPHELRTLERPLVLRTYLGEEIKGDGAQFDHWFALGDETAVRWSVGAFTSLLPEEGEDFDPSTQASQEVEERKKFGDLNYTARLTAFRDVGESGVVQVGGSARVLPSFSFDFEPSGASEGDLANTVYGADLTYGWTSETGQRRFTVGGEYLLNAGQNGAEIDDAGTPGDPTDDAISVLHRKVGGYFGFADYWWSPYNSIGAQWSALELPDASQSDQSEVEAYFTHLFSEFHRVRLVFTTLQSDVAGEDAWRIAVQYTATLGAHGHGVNW